MNSTDPSGDDVVAPVVTYPGGTSEVSSKKGVRDCEPGGTGGAPKLLGQGSTAPGEDEELVVDVVVGKDVVVLSEVGVASGVPLWAVELVGLSAQSAMATGKAAMKTAITKRGRCTDVVLAPAYSQGGSALARRIGQRL